MNRICIFGLCLALCLSFSACKRTGPGHSPAEGPAQNERTYSEPTEIPTEAPPAIADSSVVDLTQVSNMIAYAELFSMAMNPEEYVGKTVKLTGVYSFYADGDSGDTYRACTVSDNTMCCAQGIYFEPAENADLSLLPENGGVVTVQGEFQLYTMADGWASYHLVNTVIF